MAKLKRLGNLGGYTGGSFGGQVYDQKGLAPTINTVGGGDREPHIVEIEKMRKNEVKETDGSSPTNDNLVLIRQATENGTIPCKLGGIADLNYPESKTRRGRVQGDGELCPTLTTENLPSVLEPWTWSIGEEIYRIRIRKLTPKECWRLMASRMRTSKRLQR